VLSGCGQDSQRFLQPGFAADVGGEARKSISQQQYRANGPADQGPLGAICAYQRVLRTDAVRTRADPGGGLVAASTMHLLERVLRLLLSLRVAPRLALHGQAA
jgi:hypothetical protein